MLQQLLVPACAVAAFMLSSTALAADPVADVEATEQAEAETGAEAVAVDVEVSEPVTLAPKVAAEGEVLGSERLTKGGRFALGAARTLAGLTGINARFYITDHFHLGVNLGVATFSYREIDPADGADCAMGETEPNCDKTTRTLAYIGASLEAQYWILGKPAGNLFQADFGIGGRVGFQHLVNETDIANSLDDPLQLTLEIPLSIALNIGDNFAIIPEFGAAFRWNPGTRLNGPPTAMPPEPADSNPGFGDPNGRIPPGSVSGPGFGFEITDHIGLFGGASLLYTF